MKNWTYQNFTIHEFEQIESTNSYAFEAASSRQISDHEIIMAHKQIIGRGRQNRSWNSPNGNLYFSLVLRPKISAEKMPQISFVAITALQIAIAKIVKNSVQVKWPNDLLIDEKKVAGLLLEGKISDKNCEFVVIGIGLNIRSSPTNTIFPADNLKNFGIEISPKKALKNFLDEFERLYCNWLDFGFKGIRQLWLKNAYRLGKEISVKIGLESLEGVFENFDEEGNLLLRCGNETIKISVADVA